MDDSSPSSSSPSSSNSTLTASSPSTTARHVWKTQAAHPICGIPDIMGEIFEYLAPLELPQSKRNLGRAALTCRAFLEPALDCLWKSLDSLFPLLKLLPAFVQLEGTYVIRGPITTKDWERFDYYARRIRYYTYTRDIDPLDIAMHVYFRLAQLHPAPLLPSLRQITCPSISDSDILIPGVCLFISPSIRSLVFDGITSAEEKLVGTVFHALKDEGANVESIVLRATNGSSVDTLECAIRFETLQNLVLTGMGTAITLDIFNKFGSLRNIRDLTLDLDSSPVTTLEGCDLGLRDLRNLEITSSMPMIEQFLAKTSATRLESLSIVTVDSFAIDSKVFWSGVAARWADSLKKICMALDEDHIDDDENHGISEDLDGNVLSVLISLKKLEHLRVEGCVVHLGDSSIMTLASSWPNLRFMQLPFMNLVRRPTIASLRMFADCCPNLKYLCIPLDVQEMSDYVTPSPSSLSTLTAQNRSQNNSNPTPTPNQNSSSSPLSVYFPNHSLETLVIASADREVDFSQLLNLARHIDFIFPRLKVVKDYQGNGRLMWENVSNTVRMYQIVRKEVAIGIASGVVTPTVAPMLVVEEAVASTSDANQMVFDVNDGEN